MSVPYTDNILRKVSGITDPKATKNQIFKAIVAKCADGKILNPDTGRCVALNGSIGKKISERLSLNCPKDKIVNFETGRCVSKTGTIGKKLLASMGKKPKVTTKKPKIDKFSLSKKGFTIYTKEGCGYCTKAKDLIKEAGYPVIKEILVTEDNKTDIYNYLDIYTNSYRYFPMVFWNGKFIGGYADVLQEYNQKSTSIILPAPKETKTSTFIGNAKQELSSLIYLRSKHPTSCVVIPTISKKDSLKKAAGYIKEFSSIDVFVDRKEVEISSKLIDELNTCLQDDSVRFIIISLGLMCESYGHANMLIYDKTHKEMERFEPHGSSINKTMCYGLNTIIDGLLENRLRQLIPDMKKYYEPESFCPYLGPQKEESRLIATPGSDKGGGYCAAWSIWYADVRLSNPDSKREEALVFAKQMTKKDPQGIKNYIRSYSQFLKNFGDRLERSRKPEQMVDKYIKEGFKK